VPTRAAERIDKLEQDVRSLRATVNALRLLLTKGGATSEERTTT
jgi:hypothetical protein